MEISWEITDFEFISPIIGCEKCVWFRDKLFTTKDYCKAHWAL